MCIRDRNFNEISAGNMDPSELGVSAPDAQTFVVELGQPCTYFDKIASFISGAPVKQDVVEANGDAWAVDPVSYTHLDVYKRQDHDFLRGAP